MHKLKISLLTLLLLYLNCVAFAKPIVDQSTLPLKFNTGNPAPYGWPSMVITIADRKLPIVVDTGAQKYQIALTSEALKNIPVKFTGNKICSTANTGKFCGDEFIIPEVHLGSFVVKNVTGVKMTKWWGGNDASFKATEASRNGLIGYPLLSKFNVLLDYPNAKLILIKPHAKPQHYSVDQWITIPFQGHLLTKPNFNHKPITLSWDTGALPSVIKASYVDKISKKPCPTAAPYAKENCSSVQPNSFSTTEGKQLPGIWFMVVDNLPPITPFDGLVGTNFFANNPVYFDFDQKLIFVKPTHV